MVAVKLIGVHWTGLNQTGQDVFPKSISQKVFPKRVSKKCFQKVFPKSVSKKYFPKRIVFKTPNERFLWGRKSLDMLPMATYWEKLRELIVIGKLSKKNPPIKNYFGNFFIHFLAALVFISNWIKSLWKVVIGRVSCCCCCCYYVPVESADQVVASHPMHSLSQHCALCTKCTIQCTMYFTLQMQTVHCTLEGEQGSGGKSRTMSKSK